MFRKPQSEKERFREQERKRDYRSQIKNKLLTSLGNSFLASSTSASDGGLPKLATMTASGRLVCTLCKHESQDIVSFQTHVKLEVHKKSLRELKDEIEVQRTVIEHIQNLIKAQSGESPEATQQQEEEEDQNRMGNHQQQTGRDTHMDIEGESRPRGTDSSAYLNKRNPLTTMQVEERILPEATREVIGAQAGGTKGSGEEWTQETDKSLIQLMTEPVREDGLREAGVRDGEQGKSKREGNDVQGLLQMRQVSESDRTKERLAMLKERALKNRGQAGGK